MFQKINFTNFKGKLTSRKGMGMELALLVLFVVFACSILLVSSALLGKSNLNDRRDEMIRRAEVDMFAEHILDGGEDQNGKFDVSTNNATTLVIADAEGNTLLTVSKSNGIITGWVYS